MPGDDELWVYWNERKPIGDPCLKRACALLSVRRKQAPMKALNEQIRIEAGAHALTASARAHALLGKLLLLSRP